MGMLRKLIFEIPKYMTWNNTGGQMIHSNHLPSIILGININFTNDLQFLYITLNF